MNVKHAHQFCSNHRQQIEQSTTCGCFYCLETFAPQEIREWIDNGKTALCPKCSIDAVIADVSGVPLTKQFLSEMHEHWF